MFRHLIPSMIVLLGVFALMACAVRNTETHNYYEDYEIRIYEVFGMDCPGCHGGVEKLVKNITAVHDAKANWEKKTLTVWVKLRVELNDEDIFNAIRKANFTPGKRIK